MVICNSMMSACGARWSHALQLWPKSSLRPSVVSLGSAISACEKAGEWRLASHMLTANVEPNTVTYDASISSLAGHWRLSLGALQSVAKALLERVDVTFNAAITAFERAGRWSMASHALGRMDQLSVARDAISYNASMSACEKGCRWGAALTLFKEMARLQRMATWPSLSSFGGAR